MIHDTGEVNRQMLSEVKDLIGLFPYFQSAHLLLLKGLHRNEDVKFKSQLLQSAIHIADREVLYYLLNRSDKNTDQSQAKTVPDKEPRPENSDYQQVVIEGGMSSADMIAEMDADMIPVSGEKNETGSSEKMPDPVVITADSATDESASVVLIIDDGEHHVEETVVYMDPSFLVQGPVDLLELDPGSEISDTGSINQDMPANQLSERKGKGKAEQADLIDRFILSNPRIGPVADRSEKPLEDISTHFVEDTGGLVTETLAKIYFSQGYYSKAIDIYERLSLKYPEKSSYFATQIEKIREFIK